MAEVAQLGLAVDSSQVDKGVIALDKLSGAAKRAQAAAGGTASSTKNADAAAASLASSAGRAATALNIEATAAQKAANAARTHSAAMNDNIARANRMSGSMSGLAAQFQDIGVTAAMDMNPLIIGLQQGTQIAGQMEAAIQGGSSAVSVLGNAFKSLFQPLTFISIGLTVLAAAGLQMVDWISIGQTVLKGLADVLQTIAPYATMAAAGLALLYAPAILGGIKAVTLGIWGMTKALGAATLAFAAANPAAAFAIGITAAAVAANIFRDELTRIFGVDIVGVVRRAVNFVINSFFAAFQDIKFVWNNFGDIMGAAVIGGVNIAIRAIDGLVQKATQGIDRILEYINPVLEAAGMDGINPISGNFKLQELADPYADRLGKANADHAANIAAIMSRDTIGDFGTAIASGASAAADKLRDLAGSLGETEKASKKAKTEAEKLAERYNDILLDAEGFIAAQMAEKDALLLTSEAANALRYEQELLSRAIQAGIPIDAAKAAEIKSYAAAMAGAEAETNRFREALDFGKDLVRGFVSDLRSGLEQGKGFWRSFGDAALNVLDKIVDKLLNDVIDALFRVNSAAGSMGGGGGLFGFLGGLFGGGGGFTAFEHAWTAAVPGLYAKGGVFDTGISGFSNKVVNQATPFFFAKGAGVMGEAGPEAIMPLKRGPDGKLGVSAANQNRGVSVKIENYGTSKDFDVQRIGPDEVRIIARDEVSGGLREYDRGRKKRLADDLPDLRRRGAA